MITKNIVVAGRPNDSNLGDPAILESTIYMLKQILHKYDKDNIEIRIIDSEMKSTVKNNDYFKRIINKLYRISINKIITTIIGNDGNAVCEGKKKAKKFSETWRKIIDQDTIALIFAGGGIVKYANQDCEFSLAELISIASMQNIPIMLSAVGVEGYDEHDKRCAYLKHALITGSVKMITTRDDIETLTTKYCKNTNIICKRVADPACSISQVYPHPNRFKNENEICVGLGIIRPTIFREYSVDVSPKYIEDLYCDIYHHLTRQGYSCKFFCNGQVDDYDFALKISKKLNTNDMLLKRAETVKELVTQISNFDCILAGRLHTAILSYSYGIPCIEVVWNQKQIQFGHMIGHPEYYIKAEYFNTNYISDQLGKALISGYNEKDRIDYCATTMKALEEFLTGYKCIDKEM